MPSTHCMLKSCEESFGEHEAQMFRIPSDTIGRSKWQKVLNGHECIGSEWLCIKHFNPDDLSSSDGQVGLRDGAEPDPTRISANRFENENSAHSMFTPFIENHEHQTFECQNCDFLQNEVLNLRKQMAEMEKEHNLKLLHEKEKFRVISEEKQCLVDKVRRCKVKLKQLNQLVNEVTSELTDDEYDCSQSDQIHGISVDDDRKIPIIAEIIPSIGAVDPLTMDIVPGDVESAGNLSMVSADGFNSNDEIIVNGIKCEFNEEDDFQDDPFGELAVEDDGSFTEHTLADMETTQTHLTLDEIVDPDILIDDIKCETRPKSLAWRNALIERLKNASKRKRNDRLWKRNRNKLARETGSAYISNQNILVPAKKPNLTGPLCTDKCRKKCSSKFTIEQRQAAFSAYYSLDLTGKNYLIFNCIQRKDVRSHRKNTQKQKQNSFVYSIKVPEQAEPISLCKTALASLFQVSPKRLEFVQRKHLVEGEVVDMSDGRGKHVKRSKARLRVLNEVYNHFDAYGMEYTESHDNDDDAQSVNSNKKRRKKKKRASTFTVKKMFDHYIEQCKSKNLPDEYFIKYYFYAHHFAKTFNNI